MLYPQVAEAVLSLRGTSRSCAARGAGSPAESNLLRAERRARTTVRRYCVANGIDRMVTLTYAPPFCMDPTQLRSDNARMIRSLRAQLGVPFPYVYAPELHKDGVRLHAHLGLNRFVAKTVLAELWRHGFVDVRLIRVRGASSSRDHAVRAAGYFSKYVGKAFSEHEVFGRHRYEVGHGFQPEVVRAAFPTEAEGRAWLVEQMDGETPNRFWSSDDVDGWAAPPVRMAWW